MTAEDGTGSTMRMPGVRVVGQLTGSAFLSTGSSGDAADARSVRAWNDSRTRRPLPIDELRTTVDWAASERIPIALLPS